MTKAALTKTTAGQYLITTESGRVVDMGRRPPSAKRMRKACRAALSEEVVVVEVSTGTEWHL